jgi:oxygen-independent coproporphyrinogen-3 oxidase
MENPLELINKYNEPVPRYTSYPPANHFKENFTNADYLKAIVDSNNQKPNNISLYIHIPYCKQMCYYCGCNACPMPKQNEVHEYIKALKIEIQTVLDFINKKRKLAQIHYGGGTPNAIPLRYLKEINNLIFDNLDTIDAPEIAIECNPAYLGFEEVDELIEAGFNRFSFGIQDFNKNVLDNVNRESSKLDVEKLVEYVKSKKRGIKVNLDFIYGLSGQTVDSFLDTIETAAKIKPDRLVTFSYAHVPWVNKTQKILEKKGLPDQKEKLKMYYSSRDLLVKMGYHPVGFDHYVLEDDELYQSYNSKELHRNFQGYCTRRTTGQVYAFGVSSISQLERVYAQNTKDIGSYIEIINRGHLATTKGYKITDDEFIIREVINTLLCNQFINFENVADSLGVDSGKLKKIAQY